MSTAQSSPGESAPHDTMLSREELNELVIEYSTERRLIDGVEAKIIYRRPLILNPTTPAIRELAESFAPDPDKIARIREEVEELASSAYEAQQRYFRSLEATDSQTTNSEE